MSRRLPTHNPLDCSVVNLDAEDLDVNFYRLSDDLRTDLRDHDMSWLTLHYPEYDFKWIDRKRGAKAARRLDCGGFQALTFSPSSFNLYSTMNLESDKAQYILFKWRPVQTQSNQSFGGLFFIRSDESKESWKETKEENVPKMSLEFVCQAKTPAEIAAQVRQAPLERYVLFHGNVMPVQIAMPVFVGGKNLDTLNSEWNVPAETDQT